MPPASEIPVTADAPLDDRLKIALPKISCDPEVEVSPTIDEAPLIFDIVFPETFDAGLVGPNDAVSIVIEPAPFVILLKVLFVTVLLGNGVAPSAHRQPLIVVAPEKVMFEKLLRLLTSVPVVVLPKLS